MRKLKRITLNHLTTCLIFVITLFFICTFTTITLTDNSSLKERPLSKSIKTGKVKTNSENSTSKTEQLSGVSSGSDTNKPTAIASLYEQDDNDRNVISRGITSRKIYQKVNQTETISPTESNAVQSVQPEAGSQYENDLDLLARLITAEAQGEPYEAKVAVGAVVINRVQSGVWANSIKGVIYQSINGYYQFTPVINGWINKPAEPRSIEAAKAAMKGEDPTNGAQFYYDDTTTNTWILSKPVSLQIGHMIYAY